MENNRLKPYKIIDFTQLESFTNSVNKTFKFTNNKIEKSANANVTYAEAKVLRTSDLMSLPKYFDDLNPNQCVISGVPIDDMLMATIVPKGQEKIEEREISRTNKCFKFSKYATLILFDVDADENSKLFNLSIDELNEEFNLLIPELRQVEHFIRPSSSSSIYNTVTNEYVYKNNNCHYWFVAENVTDDNLEKFTEYLKRKSFELGKWELKIFKNGSVGDRYLSDVMPLKLLKSGLKFEALPSIEGESLELRPLETKYYNQGSKLALDLSLFDPNTLPDWRPIFNQEKINKRELIEAQKNIYMAEKETELIANGYSQEVAKTLVKRYIEEQLLPVKFFINNGSKNMPIINFMLEQDKEIVIADPIEPEKGFGKAIVYLNDIFNAICKSFVHGGIIYIFYFELDDIKRIIDYYFEVAYFEVIIRALIEYLITIKAQKKFVKEVSNLFKNPEHKDLFEELFDNNYVEKKALEILKDYAVLTLSGKVVLLNTSMNDLDFISISDGRVLFANKKINTYFSKKAINPVDSYIASAKRIDYSKVVFKNPSLTKDGEYNLFDKWPYEPKKVICTRFFWDFVRDIICDGNEEVFEYLMAWMSQKIQDPFSKIGTAICLNGVPGAGKSFFVKTYGSLFGKYFMATSNPKYIFGNFNSQILNKLFVYANESFWSGNKADASKIKALITEIPCVIEQKGIPAFEAENFVSLIMDTNDSFITHVERNDRRLTALTSSSARVGDSNFFEEIHKKTETEAFKQSLMFDLMNYDYKPLLPKIRKSIITNTTIEQIIYSFEPEEQWWYSILQEGVIPNADYCVNPDGTLQIANETMHTSYVDFCSKNKQRYQKHSPAFGTEISKKFFPGKLTVKSNCKFKGKNGKVYETLKMLREHFTNEYRVPFEQENMEEHWQSNNYSTYISEPKSIPSPYSNTYSNSNNTDNKPIQLPFYGK